MMRMLCLIPFLICRVLAQTYVPLFNGTSLAGWKTQGQGTWEVRDGAIHGSGLSSNTKNSWIISEKTTYRDFDFRFRYMGMTGNSGLQFRSIQGAEDVTGPQVDLDAGKTSGSLYELIVRNGQYAGAYLAQPPESQVKSLYKAQDWNLVELKVRGKHVDVTLNGTRVVNHDLVRVENEGFFSFQLHDKQVTKISLKDIEIAEVGTTGIRTPQGFAGKVVQELSRFSFLSAWDLSGRRLVRRPGTEGEIRFNRPAFHR